MKHAHRVLVILTAALAAACASRQEKTEPVETVPPPAVKAAPAKENGRKEAATEGGIVGKPAKGGKFARLKLGMTLKQVEKLIGVPDRQWQHPTGKASIPFYFGPDRWVIQYAYKNEGVLTFNYGEEQLLTRIEVNRAE